MPLLLLLLFVHGCAASEGVRSNHGPADEPVSDVEAPAQPSPVLAELFTSQGCSSCPPADAVLSKLGSREDVVALAFHVDYWDYIGWKDPFSAPWATARQRRYAQRLSKGRVYTPQLVIHGQRQLVGSKASAAHRAVAGVRRSGTRPKLSVAVGEGELAIQTSASDNGWETIVAVYESNLSTEVTRGENQGSQLGNDHVVRHLVAPAARSLSVELDPAWNLEHVGVVAFTQHRETLEVGQVTLWTPGG